MSFLTFTVTADYQALAPGSNIRGTVKFRPNLLPGAIAHGSTDGTNIGIVGGIVSAALVNGILTPASSYAPSVTLYSNDPQLNLTSDLQYTVEFHNVTVDGCPLTLDGFTFTAPSDSTPVDLVVIDPGDALQVITDTATVLAAQISDANAYTRGFLRTPTDAASARAYLGAQGFIQAAKNPDSIVTGGITLDTSGLVATAAVVWPDDTPGTLAILSRDATGAVLSYNITYGSPVTHTYTQPTITRTSAGAATNVPAIVVS